MLFEIINPSDPYTIEAPNMKIAAAACVLLGNGAYAFKPLEGEGAVEVPMFFLGGHDEWFNENFGQNTEAVCGDVVDNFKAQLAACLDSITYGSATDRREFERLTEHSEPAERQKLRIERNRNRAGSLNDIAGRAHAYARNLRATLEAKLAEPAETPAA